MPRAKNGARATARGAQQKQNGGTPKKIERGDSEIKARGGSTLGKMRWKLIENTNKIP